MKKLTLTAVATVLLLASLTGYAQVAAFAPAPPSPAPALPTAAVPLTTEQTALVVEPAQMRQLNLWLDTGDRAEGKVTVVPEGINFIIEGPDGQLVLNAGLVTDKSFAFVAATSGLYRLVFANTLALVSNKVVTVQVQHPGPWQFPYFAGTYVPVSLLEYKTLAVPLAANQQLEGSFQIHGGPWDLAFSVIGPSGNTMIPSVKVYGSHTFTFTAGTGGAYELRFDNSLCAYTSKLVSLEMSTTPGGPWQWGWAAAKLPFTASPASATAGSVFATQPVVTLQDASGNTVTTSSAPVTVTITPAANLGAVMLLGTTTVNAVNGVATFSGLSINVPGTYTLTATNPDLNVTIRSELTPTTVTTTSTGLITAVISAFIVSPRTATKLAFTTSPAGAAAGTAFAIQPVVMLQDADGNLMPVMSQDADGNLIPVISTLVTVSITQVRAPPGPCCQATTVSIFAGVATFSGLKIDLTGRNYTLTATSSRLTSANSSAFSVTPPPGNQHRPGCRLEPDFSAAYSRRHGRTNTDLPTDEAAVTYKSLWQIEQSFRELKSGLEIRPVFLRVEEHVRGHILVCFLALVLEAALQRLLNEQRADGSYSDVLSDLEGVRAVEVRANSKGWLVRTDLPARAFQAFKAVGLRAPVHIQPLS